MSFELINASIICQSIINDTLREHLNIMIIIYLNDILMFFETLNKYKKHVKQVLKTLNKKNFLFKSKKCEFHKQEVDFCEFKIKIKKIKIDSNKLNSMRK